MAPDYHFYLSYERSECKAYMERFFRDLIAEVSSLTGVARSRVAFFDQHEIGASEDWAGACMAGLEASRTLVAMFSPAYFSRPVPLQEFESFRSRADHTSGNGRSSSSILPVFWAPRHLLRNAPAPARELLQDPTGYPAEVVDEGLRLVMKRGGPYMRFVDTLAANIVRAGENAVLPAPRLSPVPLPVTLDAAGLAPPAEVSEQERLRVFLCHGTGDKPQVRELYHKLKADRVEPWFDEVSLLGGHVWEEEIPKAIKSSHSAIVCLSRHAVTRVGYVQKELKSVLDAAAEHPPGSLFVIPVKLDACDVPDALAQFHAIELFGPDGYARLKNTLDFRASQLGVEPTRWRHE